MTTTSKHLPDSFTIGTRNQTHMAWGYHAYYHVSQEITLRESESNKQIKFIVQCFLELDCGTSCRGYSLGGAVRSTIVVEKKRKKTKTIRRANNVTNEWKMNEWLQEVSDEWERERESINKRLFWKKCLSSKTKERGRETKREREEGERGRRLLRSGLWTPWLSSETVS